ncbi:AraC family transcriptional regulator [Winogradskyella sp.]|uniref:helix-turn-helix domain-containing protein n=1 Tax=Winogradskyella sp. TaxID=1883156 RepID=UPI00260EECD7|nr:AraC family transcriptional regulator [Winogradskyella sp.]
MQVRENIVRLRNDISASFPERFENEVYSSYGKTPKGFDTIDYKSNFSIKYVHSGREKYIVEGKCKIVDKNKMLIVNDSSETSMLVADGEALSIFINPEVIKDCIQGVKSFKTFLEEPFDKWNSGFSFFDSVQNIDPGLKWYFNRLLNNKADILTIDFFYELSGCLLFSQNTLQKRINTLRNKKLSDRRETFRRLEKAKDYINSNLRNPFNLEELSIVSSLSKFHLVRLFKVLYGITPHRYYVLNKLERLVKEIENNTANNYTLIELANHYGYSDYSVFYKQFKNVYGHSPSQKIFNQVQIEV